MHLVIEGGGFSGFWYNYGSLSRMSINEIERFDTIYAYSSGALALILRYANIPLPKLIEVVKRVKRETEVMRTSSKRKPYGDIVYSLLDELLEDTIHIQLNKSSDINIITSTLWGSEYINHWTSKKHVIESVIKSSYIPYISGSTFLYQNKYFDGCLSAFLSLFGLKYFGNTKVISMKIGLLDGISMIDLSRAMELYEDGFKDTNLSL